MCVCLSLSLYIYIYILTASYYLDMLVLNSFFPFFPNFLTIFLSASNWYKWYPTYWSVSLSIISIDGLRVLVFIVCFCLIWVRNLFIWKGLLYNTNSPLVQHIVYKFTCPFLGCLSKNTLRNSNTNISHATTISHCLTRHLSDASAIKLHVTLAQSNITDKFTSVEIRKIFSNNTKIIDKK